MKANEFEIRPATFQDVPTLARFNCQIAMETENKTLNFTTVSAGVEALLSREDAGFYLVATLQGEVVGCLMVTYEWSDWRNGGFWWIQSVYVRADVRRRGVFRQLYQATEQMARDNGNVCGIRLYVEQDNEIAQRTYRDVGLQRTPYQVFEVEFTSGSDQ